MNIDSEISCIYIEYIHRIFTYKTFANIFVYGTHTSCRQQHDKILATINFQAVGFLTCTVGRPGLGNADEKKGFHALVSLMLKDILLGLSAFCIFAQICQ